MFSTVDFSEETKETTAMEAVDGFLSENISVKVKDIIIRSDIDEEEKLVMLRTEEPALNEEDIDFVLSTVPENSEIYNWAKGCKEARKGLFSDKKEEAK